MIFGAPPIITNGLVLSLDAGNSKSYPGSGTTWSDLSGNSNTGTLTNGPTFSTDGGGSITSNGSNSYTNIPNTNNFSSNTLTFDLFFKPIVNPTSIGYVLAKQYNVNYGSFTLYSAGSGNYVIGVGTSTTSAASTSVNLLINNWYHVAGVYDGTNMLFYFNGRFISTTAYPGNNPIIYDSSQPINIGRYGSSYPTQLYTASRIGNLKLYNRALSASEITQNYNALKSRFNLS